MIYPFFIPSVFLVTIALIYFFGTRKLGLPPAGFRTAAGRLMECLGLGVLFYALNIACGAVLDLALVPFTRSTPYLLTDWIYLPLSLMQGILFQWWKNGPR